MTTRTYTHYHCPACGYRSTEILRENDQPYSEEWSSTDFEEGDHRARWPGTNRTFQADGEPCPKCGAR